MTEEQWKCVEEKATLACFDIGNEWYASIIMCFYHDILNVSESIALIAEELVDMAKDSFEYKNNIISINRNYAEEAQNRDKNRSDIIPMLSPNPYIDHTPKSCLEYDSTSNMYKYKSNSHIATTNCPKCNVFVGDVLFLAIVRYILANTNLNKEKVEEQTFDAMVNNKLISSTHHRYQRVNSLHNTVFEKIGAKKITNIEEVKRGDIVFFKKTNTEDEWNHVEILTKIDEVDMTMDRIGARTKTLAPNQDGAFRFTYTFSFNKKDGIFKGTGRENSEDRILEFYRIDEDVIKKILKQ
ncbi:MAG: hypothetical protein GX922_06375 [Firmicutes bacterium]|nr:hypothetical protein [Bacillota bacterium]HBG87589.1 hypothetical protein [Marinilabiliaceae bacterium]